MRRNDEEENVKLEDKISFFCFIQVVFMSEDYVVILTSYIDNKYTSQIALLIVLEHGA